MSVSANPFDPIGGMTLDEYLRKNPPKTNHKPQYIRQDEQISIIPTQAQVKRDLRERILIALIQSPNSCSGYDFVSKAKEIVAFIEGGNNDSHD